MNDRRPDLHAVECATAQRPQAPRPQLMMVRGGGSAASRSIEASPTIGGSLNGCLARSPGVVAIDLVGIIAPGQTAAQSGEQVGLQQPISSWLAIPDIDDVAIGQSGASDARAGPDAAARERASQSKRNKRRIWLE